jgi:hypothetical protein
MKESSTALSVLENEAGGLLARLFGPACDEIGLALQESMRIHRLKNSVRVLRKARQFLEKSNIDPQTVEPRILVPLLEGASLEEDERLSDKWAALLANSLSPSSHTKVLPGFVNILTQLSPPEAKILDLLLNRWHTDDDRNGHLQASYLVQELEVSGVEYEVMSGNLIRLGLCRHFVPPRMDTSDGYDPDGSIHLAQFGIAFVEACRPPVEEGEPWH